MKEDLFILILMIVSVPLTGQLNFHPFHDTFRVSFATPIFLFFLLWIKRLPLALAGTVVGISVVSFRIALDWFIGGRFYFEQNFMLHFPSFFYYLSYSWLFHIAKVNSFHHRPLLIGALSVLIDVFSSMMELFIRHYILNNIISIYTVTLIVIIAIIRSFFVLGFFNIIKLNEAKLRSQQQEEQNRYMLLLISGLYEESVQLKKSLKYAEDITRRCYDLYQNLQNSQVLFKSEDLAKELLSIAGQVHEIKKDNQRIYAGLSKMILSENSKDYMTAEEIGNIIIQTNKKYANSLSKDIDFISHIDNSLIELHVYTVLSLINNLVSNAVESIKDNGKIKIYIYRVDNWVKFKICDNGVGIPQKKIKLIFKPGYTTKYDLSGKPSTGMGLPYIKEVVKNLQGIVTVESYPNKSETTFIIKLPIDSLIKKG